MMRNYIKFIASVGFLGYFPLISGTVTSGLFAVIIYYYLNSVGLFLFFGILTIVLGFLICGRAAYVYNRDDPRQVVIDELAGTFVALFLIPHHFRAYLIAFIFFRLFDIFKPFAIGRVEKIKGSVGIMLDDLLAGLLANIVTQVISRFILK